MSCILSVRWRTIFMLSVFVSTVYTSLILEGNYWPSWVSFVCLLNHNFPPSIVNWWLVLFLGFTLLNITKRQTYIIVHFLEYAEMIIKFKITNAPVEYCNRLFKKQSFQNYNRKTHHANMLNFVKKSGLSSSQWIYELDF